MIAFAKTLIAGLLLLGVFAVLCARLIPAYHLPSGGVALALMALNTLIAVALLRGRTGRNSIQIIFASMAGRLLGLGVVMALGAWIFKPSQSMALSFAFTAMMGYAIFQTLEIRFFLRQEAIR